MRVSFTHLLLASAVVAAPVHDAERRDKGNKDVLFSRGFLSFLPRALLTPVHPVTPAHPAPVHVAEPVRPIGEPIRPPTTNPDAPVTNPNSPDPIRMNPNDPPPHDPNQPEVPARLDGQDPPPKNPNEPEPPSRLGENTPAKNPVEIGPSCSRKRGLLCEGANPSLGIDENYNRQVNKGEPPKHAYVDDAGLNPPGADWYKTSVDNGPVASKYFEEVIIPEFDKLYGPGGSKQLFDPETYEWFRQSQIAQFGNVRTGMHRQPFITTSNNHGENPSLIVEQMFKERDLYNGCKECEFAGVKFERPPVPRPENVKEVFPSQEIADNWRVSAHAADADPKKINSFGMNNVATPESQDIFRKLFPAQEPKKTFKAGEPGFDDIEKTVQAKTVDRLLRTEEDTFGKKKVTEHIIYRVSDQEWHMVSKVADVQPAS